MSRKSAAQVAAAKKAARLKADNQAKRPQHPWLQQQALLAPASDVVPPVTPERNGEAHLSQGPPRLLSKAEVLVVAGCTFPTVWKMMRQGKFPRSRVVGGKSMWLSTEIDAWLADLPVRALKGDAEVEVA
jgi:prophage regulatory protein